MFTVQNFNIIIYYKKTTTFNPFCPSYYLFQTLCTRDFNKNMLTFHQAATFLMIVTTCEIIASRFNANLSFWQWLCSPVTVTIRPLVINFEVHLFL